MNVPSDDPIDWFDPEEADVSISNKGEIFKLPDFTLQQLQESALLAILNLSLVSPDLPPKLPR